ncbi:MAG: ribonuclease III [Candidatus Competibacteraceae bacterium]|nr:ribonuclease III [Candidatus Competibacteraceae bacterium]
MSPAVGNLCHTLQYTFHNPHLLEEALTHRSAAGHSNERLEFLGDSILNMVIAAQLFAAYPQASEGELSRLRATLVKGDTLAELARELALGDCLRLGAGELKSGGKRRASILANALEAIFGAVFLDSDFVTCRQLILNLYQNYLNNLPTAEALKDPKTQLQEYLQARGLPLPAYKILEVSGEVHAQRFTVECNTGAVCTIAVGSSRRKAEQQAAQQALEAIGE